ncbi:MAG TPA: site-2 protease family protein [Sandaracinaceae bacterium LLY-WYZ-13_1]|nr:site-2 protease family protein [Sandaracinaceae bacterium LLY-WYZ-13_1]
MATTTHDDDAPKQRKADAGSAFGRIPLGRLFGINIRADWSVLIIGGLVAGNLGLGMLPQWHPDWGPVLTWAVAVGAAVLFLASILVHEMSHALVGRKMGIPVRNITLFIFGGMAHTEKEPPSPRAELLMAAAGPVTSLALGLAATFGGLALASVSFANVQEPTEALSQIGPTATLLLWLGPINIILGVFNMVPGFPLDGGRVLRAILWAWTKDLTKATKWASLAGQGFAAVLAAWGIISLLGGNVVQGIWLLLIAWFLRNAARAGYTQTLIQQALAGTKVGQVMRRRLIHVPPNISVATLVDDYLMASDQQCFPVVSDDRHLEGIVCLEDVRGVPRDAWPTTPVRDAMTPASELETTREDAPATDVLRQLGTREVDQVPVVDPQGALLGLVRRQDVLRWLALHDDRLRTT